MSRILARVTSRMALGVSLAGVACSPAARIEQRSGDPESVGGDPSSNRRGDQDVQAGNASGNPEPPLVVETHDGKLRGLSTGVVDEFMGIRYAAPPVGKLRLASPAAPAPWDGIHDANQPGAVCPQFVTSGVVGDEDCLWLNVYRPANTGAQASLPVMVWIHGGSFKSGAGSEFDPGRLVATNDIIVVTINYRLGPLGFLSGDGLSGDYGLQDQQAALRWVRDNIAAFGGDPQQVTIQGESAGGASVCAQLASPSAGGLFSRAVIQSASCASVSLEFAKSQAELVAAKLGCRSSELASCLADEKLGADRIVRAGELGGAIYGIVAGSGVLPLAPMQVVAARQQWKVPVLIGGITDEMSLFTVGDRALLEELNQNGYRGVLAHWFASVDTDRIVTEYPLNGYKNAFFALGAVLNDSGVYYGQALGGCVTAAVADALSVSVATYAYELDDLNFTWSSGGVGASHMSDLPYLFDITHPFSQPLTATQSKLADTMVRSWGVFASGDPPGEDWPMYAAAPDTAVAADTTVAANTRYFNPDARPGFIDLRTKHHCDFWQKACGSYAERCPYPAR
jgi:para-nitrobenzyl esterase